MNKIHKHQPASVYYDSILRHVSLSRFSIKTVLFLMVASVGYSVEVEFWPDSETIIFKHPGDAADNVSINIEQSALRIMVSGQWWTVPAGLLDGHATSLGTMYPNVKHFDEYDGGLYIVTISLYTPVLTADSNSGTWLSLYVNKSTGYISIWPTKVPGETLWYSLPSGDKLDKAPIWKYKTEQAPVREEKVVEISKP